jgi:hypothetical protein
MASDEKSNAGGGADGSKARPCTEDKTLQIAERRPEIKFTISTTNATTNRR